MKTINVLPSSGGRSGKMTPSTFGVPQMAGGFEVIQGKCSISVLGVITPHTRHFRRKQIGNEVCFLMSQAASEDYLKVSTGFDQVIKYQELIREQSPHWCF